MNEFSTASFDFYHFSPGEEQHRNLIMELNSDTESLLHLGIIFDILLVETGDLCQVYMVGNKAGEIIGYLNVFDNFYSEVGPSTLAMHYAVAKSFRTIGDYNTRNRSIETVGSKILRESSNHFLETNAKLRELALFINANNIRSIKAALHAGFRHVGKDVYLKSTLTEYIPDVEEMFRGFSR